MRLSAENINKRSPYWVIQLDDMLFRFRTKNGITYRVGFQEDRYFKVGNAYNFFITNVDYGDRRVKKVGIKPTFIFAPR